MTSFVKDIRYNGEILARIQPHCKHFYNIVINITGSAKFLLFS